MKQARGKPGPWRKPISTITDERPAIEVPDDWKPGPELDERPIIHEWRRLGPRMTGVVSRDLGERGDGIETIPGLIAKIFVRGGWVLMDDGEIYRLGNRAYPGT